MAVGSVHGLAGRDIGGRSAGYGSPEVGGPLPPTRSVLLDYSRDVIHGVIRCHTESRYARSDALYSGIGIIDALKADQRIFLIVYLGSCQLTMYGVFLIRWSS